MKVERGGKAIVAAFVGAWFVTFAIATVAEVNFTLFIIGIPVFITLLVVWVLKISGNTNTESEVPSD